MGVDIYMRHGAIVTETTSASYTGVSTKLKLPSQVNYVNGYVDWYLGIGKTNIEGGISYSSDGFKVFINGVEGAEKGQRSFPVSSLAKGQTVDLKLIYDHSTKRATLYLNGSPLSWTNNVPVKLLSGLNTYNTVKMVHGVQDEGGSSFSQASFSETQLRMNTSGSTYKTWTSSLSKTAPRVVSPGTSDSADQFTVYSNAPLSTKLDPK
ncbi:hypothetical protein [Paenibacillus jiagnxiensis]|uniref:hypothetical protein n=1 Tax=Paenibacillus jiagnxiensis TaxID=3228926 RepID=UPI0033AF9459